MADVKADEMLDINPRLLMQNVWLSVTAIIYFSHHCSITFDLEKKCVRLWYMVTNYMHLPDSNLTLTTLCPEQMSISYM